MARPKKQVKLKEPIKIRLKSLADGNKSIYLDIYYKGVRKYEYLKLYLVPEINPVCKEQNKQTMAIAERIKAERIKALHGHGIQDWETDIFVFDNLHYQILTLIFHMPSSADSFNGCISFLFIDEKKLPPLISMISTKYFDFDTITVSSAESLKTLLPSTLTIA